MSLDISHILDDWPFKPGEVTARRIVGADGQEKIQVRLDLGLLQMEASGRPDGQMPHGHESLLAYYEYLLQKHVDEAGSDDGFSLDEPDCEALRAEGVMYYHRYLAEFVLGNYERVDRDTMRNTRLMDFCRKYARNDSDRYILEQYRAYVIMMRTRARRSSRSTPADSSPPCQPPRKASPTSRRSTTRSAGTRCASGPASWPCSARWKRTSSPACPSIRSRSSASSLPRPSRPSSTNSPPSCATAFAA